MNTTRKQHTPFGRWKSSFTPSAIAATLRLSDVQWTRDGETLVWLEERSDRGVLVCRDLGSSGQRDLTRELSVRAGIGYGGGDFAAARDAVYFASEGRLYKQVRTSQVAEPITPSGGEVTSAQLSPDEKWLLYIHSENRTDTLRIVSTRGDSHPVQLDHGHDFYMQPVWHPSGLSVAWISWDHPHMPWEHTCLMVARLDFLHGIPRIVLKRVSKGKSKDGVAYFQPCFSPDGGYLSVVADESDWFNIHLLETDSLNPTLVIREEAEHGVAAWMHGTRTHAWTPDSRSIYYVRSKHAFSSLAKFDLKGQKTREVSGEVSAYTALRQISVSPRNQDVALIGSASGIPPRILVVKGDGRVETMRRTSAEIFSPDCYSRPRKISWYSGEGECHALYYPPANPPYVGTGLPPAIIRLHGGPTSQYNAGFSADTQFFTSRGYAVLNLNYRGSEGYGRSYRSALNGAWGVLDVEDTRSAGEYLIREKLADDRRVVVAGGSAGGYTVLMSLIRFPSFFRAGICRYGVSDLAALARDTHKLEEHYLDTLIGVLPENEEIYRARSPIFLADRIQDPVAIFQGDRDKVVPQSQSDRIVASLKKRGIPHIYRVFPGEGHGWRHRETIQAYYETVEQFLERYVLSDPTP